MSGRGALAYLLAAVVGIPMLLAGCGGSDAPSPVKQRSIAAGVEPPANALIGEDDIDGAASDSASRAFLAFWSSLQWQAWADAVTYYSPSMQFYIGTERIIEGLKFQTSYFRSTKPVVVRETERRGETTVRYEVVDTQGRKTPSSTTWRRENGQWAMIYDANLDQSLRGWAQGRTQQMTDPNAEKPSAKALTAGIEASELQSKYLANLRRQPQQGARR